MRPQRITTIGLIADHASIQQKRGTLHERDGRRTQERTDWRWAGTTNKLRLPSGGWSVQRGVVFEKCPFVQDKERGMDHRRQQQGGLVQRSRRKRPVHQPASGDDPLVSGSVNPLEVTNV